MRSQFSLALVVILGDASVLLAQGTSRPSAVLASAREAIGIRAGGPALRSVRMEGTRMTTQAVTTDQRAGVVRSTDREYSVVIEVVPPDRYVVTTTSDGSTSRETVDRGRGMIARRRVDLADSPWETRESPEALVEARRIVFARLALGVLGRADVISTARVRDVGPSTLEIHATVGSQPFSTTLELDPATRLPVRQTYRARTQVYPRNSILGKISDSSGGAGAVDPSGRPEIEIVMTFSDHRLVSGFRLPFRITRSATGVVLTDMRFTKIEVNPGGP